MADNDTRRTRVKDKVAASQDRLKRESRSRRASPEPSTPEKAVKVASDHPFFTLGLGLLIGFIAASLVPRGAFRRAAKGAVALGSVAGELGTAFGKQAAAKASEVAEDGREAIRRLDLGEKLQDGRERLKDFELGDKLGELHPIRTLRNAIPEIVDTVRETVRRRA